MSPDEDYFLKEYWEVPNEKSHRSQAVTQEYSSKQVPKAEYKQSWLIRSEKDDINKKKKKAALGSYQNDLFFEVSD